MKNNITELVFIIDRSGSMVGLEKDTVGGFNSLIKKQRKQSGKCYVTTILFNSEIQMLHDRLELSEVKRMTEKMYAPVGCTALIDAIGKTIDHIGKIHKYAREQDVPEHTMFVITTDGIENASHDYRAAQVRKMIEYRKEKYGWEFLFIGANIDSVHTAGELGISSDRAANYHADGQGVDVMFDSISDAVCAVRSSEPLTKAWSGKIDADYNKRK